MLHRIEIAKLRHDPLEERLVGEALAVFVHHHGVRAAQLDDPGMHAQAGLAGLIRRNGVGEHHPQAVLDLVQDAADLGAVDEAVAGERRERQAVGLLVDAGDLLEVAAHLRVRAVAAGADDHALARRDAFARAP